MTAHVIVGLSGQNQESDSPEKMFHEGKRALGDSLEGAWHRLWKEHRHEMEKK